MPELPEVETTLQGISRHIKGQKIQQVIVRHHGLRWPITANLSETLTGTIIRSLSRRGKYLLLAFNHGTLILHLGMSGRLGIFQEGAIAQKHDHLDIVFQNKKLLRLTDPRRFGACLWTAENAEQHFLLKDLGIEPLTPPFNGKFLFEKSRKRKVPVKSFIMNSHIVVGVGNIYAAESLFDAGIHPNTPAGKISLEKYSKLASAIQKILKQAIKKGGTTLKDFLDSEGKPGYFSLKLKVYDRAGKPCVTCKTPLSHNRLGQRSTVYCKNCQKK